MMGGNASLRPTGTEEDMSLRNRTDEEPEEIVVYRVMSASLPEGRHTGVGDSVGPDHTPFAIFRVFDLLK